MQYATRPNLPLSFNDRFTVYDQISEEMKQGDYLWSFKLEQLGTSDASLPNKNAPRYRERRLLAYLDSNQDKLNQNQLYYHYTIGQSDLLNQACARVKKECKNKVSQKTRQKNLGKIAARGRRSNRPANPSRRHPLK